MAFSTCDRCREKRASSGLCRNTATDLVPRNRMEERIATGRNRRGCVHRPNIIKVSVIGKPIVYHIILILLILISATCSATSQKMGREMNM